MSTSVRARRDTRGFSFVELLVTIIIASIAFAAMVPLFVQAQGQNSADQARNVALQVAQDRIEKIRQLDYEQITLGSLESTTYPSLENPQFGTTWDFVRNGSTKRYTIQYTVAPVMSATNQEQYKRVTVRVTWTAPPSPVKAAVLQTIVYPQYAGPEIESVTVGLPDIFDPSNPPQPPALATIYKSPVVIDVRLKPEDILSMNAIDPLPENRGWVKFTVTSFTGVTVASEEANAIVSNEPGHYQCVWDNSAAADGVYRIEVTAVSASETQGSTVTKVYYVSLLEPPAPTGLIATPGNARVSLSWDQSVIGDFAHYELWKDNAFYQTLTFPNFSDTAVTNGNTYYYKVLVVDTGGNKSVFSAEKSALPAQGAEIVPPTVPKNLSAVKLANAGTINLAWTASTDNGSGVLGYIIERRPNDSSPWVQLQGSYPNVTYPDSSAGWGMTWYYRIAAIDKAGNASACTSSFGPVTTDAHPKYSLTVNNATGAGIYVWVQSVGAGLEWYTQNGTPSTVRPSGVDLKKSGAQSTKIWSNLPAGVYNVYASTSTSGTPVLTAASGSGDLTAGNGSITF